MGKLSIAFAILVGVFKAIFGISDKKDNTNEELIKEEEYRHQNGEYQDQAEAESEVNIISVDEPEKETKSMLPDNSIKCPSCGTHMKKTGGPVSDFCILKIFECPKCHTVSEYQYETKTLNMLRIVHVFDRMATNTSAFMETEGIIDYKNFSLDRLWAIGGVLCYPALVKSEFSTKESLVFIKVGADISYKSVEGFLINANNVIGHVKYLESHAISHFVNPYLSNLPYPEYMWISSPTLRCSQLEVVYNIRFSHNVSGKNGVWIHQLDIIKDIPMRAMGVEVHVRFYALDEIDWENEPMTMIELIEKIDLKSIILGSNDIAVDDRFGIQAKKVAKHNLSSVSTGSIDDDLREEFYKDIKHFFWLYDKSTKHVPNIIGGDS